MTTRADFYIGRGPEAEWIGSIAIDGHPSGASTDDKRSTGGAQALVATTEGDFREGVRRMAETRADFTSPERGWPWPWGNSATTNYAYAFEAGAQDRAGHGEIYASAFGSPWWVLDLNRASGGEPLDVDGEPIIDGPAPVFPDMTDRKNVRWDEGSGLTVI